MKPFPRLSRTLTRPMSGLVFALLLLAIFFEGPRLFAPWAKPVVAWATEVIKGPPMKDLPIQKLSEHVWIIQAPDGFPTPENQGMMANITLVETQRGFVVLDTGASVQIGEMVIRQLAKISNKPVIAIYNSHYHGDHFLGNQAFVERFGVMPIYAHPKTIEAVAGQEGKSWVNAMERWTNLATTGTTVVPPTHAVQHGDSHSYGDVTLKVHHYGRAHTNADISVEIVQDRVTYVGDIAMDRRIANLDDGSYVGSLKTMDALAANANSKLWVPGHGSVSADLLKNQAELFQGIYESCRKAVQDGKPLDAAKAIALADPRVAKWAPVTKGWDANLGKYVSIAYLEAEANDF